MNGSKQVHAFSDSMNKVKEQILNLNFLRSDFMLLVAKSIEMSQHFTVLNQISPDHFWVLSK